MPGILWYFVIALLVLIGLILAVPGDGHELPTGQLAFAASHAP